MREEGSLDSPMPRPTRPSCQEAPVGATLPVSHPGPEKRRGEWSAVEARELSLRQEEVDPEDVEEEPAHQQGSATPGSVGWSGEKEAQPPPELFAYPPRPAIQKAGPSQDRTRGQAGGGRLGAGRQSGQLSGRASTSEVVGGAGGGTEGGATSLREWSPPPQRQASPRQPTMLPFTEAGLDSGPALHQGSAGNTRIVWMIGHSIYWANLRAQQRVYTSNLGLDASKFKIFWCGKRRMLWLQQLNIQVMTHLQSWGEDVPCNKLRENFTIREMGHTKQTGKEKKVPYSPPIQNKNKEAIKLSCKLENMPDNHDLVDGFVEKFRDDLICPPDNEVTNNLHIRICGLHDTVYSGENYRLESWGQNVLPKPTKMKVLGIIESSNGMLLIPQWIVLVGKNGHVYGYKEEMLFLHANSLNDLVQDGIKEIETYSDDISDEEEEVLRKDEEVQRLRKATKEFIDKDADEFNDFYAEFIS